MNISYDYYRIFFFVAKYKNISQAAKVLLSNQPNVTRTIKNLESALGCTLFVRNRYGVELTPEGEKLYSHIKIAYEHIEAGEEEISLDKTLQSGIISIGATEIALHCMLLPILKEYRSLYPGVKIHISNHTTYEAVSALKNGLLDLALVTTPTAKSSSIAETKVKKIREVPVCSKAYPKLLSGKVPLSILKDYPIIMLSSATKTYERYSDIFDKNNITFSPSIEAATTDQILPMVKADLGVGFIPEDMLIGQSDAYKIDLTEPLPERHICLLKRREYHLNVAAKKMEEMILSIKE